MLAVLNAEPTVKSAGRGYKGSQLALMMDDLRSLPGVRNKIEYFSEYLFPPKDYLLQRYGKTARSWLPVLYFRYILGGLYEKIALR